MEVFLFRVKALLHLHYFSDPKYVLLYLPQHFSVCSDGVPSLPKHHQQTKPGKRSLCRHSRCSKPVEAWLDDVCVCVFPPVYSPQCWWCWKSSSAGSRNENLFHSWWVWCISDTFLCWFRTPHAFIVILCCIQNRYELTMNAFLTDIMKPNISSASVLCFRYRRWWFIGCSYCEILEFAVCLLVSGTLVVCFIGLLGEASVAWSSLIHPTARPEMRPAPQHVGRPQSYHLL